MDNIHRGQIIEEIGHCQHHEVVSDVEFVPHDVSRALLVDEPPDGAGQQSEGAGGDFVADVMNSIVVYLVVLTQLPPSLAVVQQDLANQENAREENEANQELSGPSQHPGLVHGGVVHFKVRNENCRLMIIVFFPL